MISSERPTICTIIAKNYVSFARTLCNSFLELHPDGKCYVLIIDEYDGYIDPEEEVFEIIKLGQLNIDNINDMCFRYDILELATATKPFLLKHLLDSRNISKIIYFDPDILITNKLDNLFKELIEYDFIITPHLDKDYPDDSALPNDSTIMMHGSFNLGFIGIRRSENASRFLMWWQRKLYNKCLKDPAKGYYVDQRFIDLAVSLFKCYKIVYDTGCNVAYWNLHSRSVDFVHGSWRCNEDKMYFYHFSSYKPEKPDEISAYQSRYVLKNISGLHSLFNTYKTLIIGNGYYDTHKWPYNYNSFNNGKPITDLDRKLYRDNIGYRIDMNPFDIGSYPARSKMIIQGFKIFHKYSVIIYNYYMTIYKMLGRH